jgi:hypothetical protein
MACLMRNLSVFDNLNAKPVEETLDRAEKLFKALNAALAEWIKRSLGPAILRKVSAAYPKNSGSQFEIFPRPGGGARE